MNTSFRFLFKYSPVNSLTMDQVTSTSRIRTMQSCSPVANKDRGDNGSAAATLSSNIRWEAIFNCIFLKELSS
ncbi:hypothetical protein RIF29_41910 [Crotalaria pallida]|uniref:Uncharacterized protein n=1 Tax=Crotalaria pallida TaxID=3830 RepID=A0AAN9HRY6_CROPI